jgi:hypothetical protein
VIQLGQLAVSIQNYLAIDIVIKNNVVLKKGADRGRTSNKPTLLYGVDEVVDAFDDNLLHAGKRPDSVALWGL